MGVVSLAIRHLDGTPVALKIIQPIGPTSKRDVDRFLREANILRQLDHPSIVAFRDMGEVNRILWFAMEFVPGTDASAQVKKKGPLPSGEAHRSSQRPAPAMVRDGTSSPDICPLLRAISCQPVTEVSPAMRGV